MRTLKGQAVFWIGIVAALGLPGMAISADPPRVMRVANADGVNIDLAVRQVTVTPIRAHVGDPVLIEVLVENKAEGMGTTPALVLANGKVVARQLFTWGISPGDRLYRMTFTWDTRDASPGKYKIRAEAFVWEDSSPFDNQMDVPQPVLLVPQGAGFPNGESAGGSATETDPRFNKSRPGG